MVDYEEIYEILRKEKYGENLQQLPEKFVEDFVSFIQSKKGSDVSEGDLLSQESVGSRKELENALAMFKELMLRRKKKLLNLVFAAAETGIMKRDYENMFSFERDLFDKLVKAVEEGDKELNDLLHGNSEKSKKGEKNRLLMFNQEVEEFVDMSGNAVGPFASGELVNLASEVAEVLVGGGKATFVDEE